MMGSAIRKIPTVDGLMAGISVRDIFTIPFLNYGLK